MLSSKGAEEEMATGREEEGEDLPGAAALSSFSREKEHERKFSEQLKSILEVIATTGKYWHDWDMLKGLLSFRLKQVLSDYNTRMISENCTSQTIVYGEAYTDLLNRLDQALNSFTEGPPFTLQRLCEILLNAQNIYSNIAKVSLALEKTLLVTSNIPRCNEPYPTELISSLVSEKVEEKQLNPESSKENGNKDATDIADEDMVDCVNDDNELTTNSEHKQVDTVEESSVDASFDGNGNTQLKFSKPEDMSVDDS